MTRSDLSEWLNVAILLLVLAILAGIVCYVVREFFLSRHTRRRFRAALSRLRAMDWKSGMGWERQKKLTYRPEQTQDEDKPDN